MVYIPGTVLLVKHFMPQLVLQHFCEAKQSPSDVQLSLRTDPSGQLSGGQCPGFTSELEINSLIRSKTICRFFSSNRPLNGTSDLRTWLASLERETTKFRTSLALYQKTKLSNFSRSSYNEMKNPKEKCIYSETFKKLADTLIF